MVTNMIQPTSQASPYKGYFLGNMGPMKIPTKVPSSPSVPASPAAPTVPATPITNNTTISTTGAVPVQSGVVPQTGLIGSEAALNTGMTNALGAINTGTATAQQNLNAIGGITQPLDAYSAGGASAFNQMSGLTGTGTPEQNAAAMEAYKASPGYNYVLDQTLRGTERSAAARGGLLGGNVALELQRNAAGLASTDYQNQFNNLNTLAQTGLGASSASAGIKADAKARLASLAESSGLNIASLYTGTAQQLAGGRAQAGRDIAQNATGAASQISKLLSDQGIVLSDMIGKDISSITDMIYQSGMQDKIDNQNLAAILANINSGQASNVMQGNQAIGAANAAGIMGTNAALQSGLQNAIATGLIKAG